MRAANDQVHAPPPSGANAASVLLTCHSASGASTVRRANSRCTTGALCAGWETQEEGVVAKFLVDNNTKDIPVGKPMVVVVDSEDAVSAFESFSADDAQGAAAANAAEGAAGAAGTDSSGAQQQQQQQQQQ